MGTFIWSGPQADQLMMIPLDEELDRYRMLAYLQRIDRRFQERKLYPHLEELHANLERMEQLREQWQATEQTLPGDLIGFDPGTCSPIRSRERSAWQSMLELIMDRSLPVIREALERGTELRNSLVHSLHIGPVGVVPLHVREGFLILRQGLDATVYEYAMPVYRDLQPEKKHHSVRTRFVSHCTLSMAYREEQVKSDLLRSHPDVPNPAVFAFVSDITLPRVETFMPLAKRWVYELIAGTADQ